MQLFIDNAVIEWSLTHGIERKYVDLELQNHGEPVLTATNPWEYACTHSDAHTHVRAHTRMRASTRTRRCHEKDTNDVTTHPSV